MEFRRGDIFYVKNGKTTGSEMQGSRPAIIVSNDKANEHGPNVTVVWLTSQEKHSLPTHCTVKAQMLSTALCESINTVSKERIGDYIRTASEKEMVEVDRCLGIALELTVKSDGVPVAEPYVYQDNTGEMQEMFETLISNIDTCYFGESNAMKAEGIDIALREVRQMYRKMLVEGV